MMSSAALRILSGVHLGAEIVLEEGTWAVGRDDSCDIILSDAALAPRHCALTIGADGTVTASSVIASTDAYNTVLVIKTAAAGDTVADLAYIYYYAV